MDDAKTREYLLTLIRRGAPPGVACDAAGVRLTQLDDWLQRGEPSDPEFQREKFDFAQQYRQAEAEHEIGRLEAVQAQEGADWRAPAWVLGKRHAARWGQQVGLGAWDSAVTIILGPGTVEERPLSVDASVQDRPLDAISGAVGARSAALPSPEPAEGTLDALVARREVAKTTGVLRGEAAILDAMDSRYE